MKNGINVVGDVGVGDYQVTWDQRFTECELFGSYSHPLPIIGSFILFNLSLILFKANPHGLINKNNYSTALDQAYLCSVAIKNQRFK